MKKAVFPGSFNPFTVGHEDIVRRGLKVFDHVVIAIGINAQKEDAELERRLDPIRNLFKDNPRVSIEVYSTLTVDFAHECGAQFILRGVRSFADYDYELQMADANRLLAPDIETVILFASPELACISSSLMRELERYGRSIP